MGEGSGGNGTETESLFLQTISAQAVAGAFTWAALIITGHQVSTPHSQSYSHSSGSHVLKNQSTISLLSSWVLAHVLNVHVFSWLRRIGNYSEGKRGVCSLGSVGIFWRVRNSCPSLTIRRRERRGSEIGSGGTVGGRSWFPSFETPAHVESRRDGGGQMSVVPCFLPLPPQPRGFITQAPNSGGWAAVASA